MDYLLVNSPSGVQELITIGPGGEYFDPARVLWDTRVDGPLPEEITLGGMIRQGDALVFDQAQKDQHDSAIYMASVPESVTALQGLLALDAAGISAEYQAWADDPARTFAEKAFINKARTWRRDNAVLAAGAEAIGVDEAGLNALFIAAAAIEP